MMLKEIGERVREARNAKNFSQAGLAEALHVSTPYISNIEQGKQAMSITILIGICETLNVSADWILGNSFPESNRIIDEEISNMLHDCSSAERRAILKLIRGAKEAFSGIKREYEGRKY